MKNSKNSRKKMIMLKLKLNLIPGSKRQEVTLKEVQQPIESTRQVMQLKKVKTKMSKIAYSSY